MSAPMAGQTYRSVGVNDESLKRAIGNHSSSAPGQNFARGVGFNHSDARGPRRRRVGERAERGWKIHGRMRYIVVLSAGRGLDVRRRRYHCSSNE